MTDPHTDSTGSTRPTVRRNVEGPIRAATAVVGAVFLLVGVLGFVPGVTTNTDLLEWTGPDSGAELLGVFQVSVLHNLLHLALGVVGLIASRRALVGAWYLVIGGVAYAGLWVYGLAVPHHSDANVVPLNDADNWLHLVLAVGMLGLGAAALSALRREAGVRTQGEARPAR